MDQATKDTAIECSKASDEGRMTFPQVVMRLMEAGVEQYYSDLRRAQKIYYLPNGESYAVETDAIDQVPAMAFDAAGVSAAIRAIQAQKISYRDFCRQIMAAGCVSYVVSLVGRRAVYLGRTGESFVEPFPTAQ